jgi:hypothetical protein
MILNLTNLLLPFFIIAFSICPVAAQDSGFSTQDDISDDLQLVRANRQSGSKRSKNFCCKGSKRNNISIEDFGKGENLVVKIKGKTDETIVVGAHYDKIGAGCGAIDNWTGIVILAHLYKTISLYELIKPMFLSLSTRKKAGCLVKAMVKAIPKEVIQNTARW